MNPDLIATLRDRLPGPPPELAIVTGSGLGDLAGIITDPVSVSYTDLPGAPVPTVAGHTGELIRGTVGGQPVLLFVGRVHLYEDRPATDVVFPVRIARALDTPRLLVTNAAGAIGRHFQPGDLMLIDDQINLTGTNPLTGRQPDSAAPDATPFVDMTDAYSPRLKKILLASANAENIALQRGVYLGIRGPSYETPAEIRAFARLGADAVGMSTVLEVIEARYHGLEVAGVSVITNHAAGLNRRRLSHREVLRVGQTAVAELGRLITALARECQAITRSPA